MPEKPDNVSSCAPFPPVPPPNANDLDIGKFLSNLETAYYSCSDVLSQFNQWYLNAQAAINAKQPVSKPISNK